AKVKAIPPPSGTLAQPGETTTTAQDKTGKTEDALSAGALKAAAEVSEQIAEAFKAGDKLHDGVSVQATDKGVIISITDQLDFGMFQIGSATPNHDLVLAMDKI